MSIVIKEEFDNFCSISCPNLDPLTEVVRSDLYCNANPYFSDLKATTGCVRISCANSEHCKYMAKILRKEMEKSNE